jgi:hypothetical protein
MFVPITKVNEWESNTPCPSTHWKSHTPRVEKLSKALIAMMYLNVYLCTGKLLNGDSIWWLTSEQMDALQMYPCNSHGRKI